jgi:hypothetical protein
LEIVEESARAVEESVRAVEESVTVEEPLQNREDC